MKQLHSTKPKLTEVTIANTGETVMSFESQSKLGTELNINEATVRKRLRKGTLFYYLGNYCHLSQREMPSAKVPPSVESRRVTSWQKPHALTAVHTGTVYRRLPSRAACARLLGVDITFVRRGVPFHHGGILCQLSEAHQQQARLSHTSAPGATHADAAAKNSRHSDSATAATTAPMPPQPTAKEEGAATTPVPVPVPGAVAPLPIWQRLGPLTRGAEAYARAQRRRPWATQVATMLVIYLCADISAQQISGKDEHEYARTARSLTIGGVAAIPGHMW